MSRWRWYGRGTGVGLYLIGLGLMGGALAEVWLADGPVEIEERCEGTEALPSGVYPPGSETGSLSRACGEDRQGVP